jgi:hypothetical protein
MSQEQIQLEPAIKDTAIISDELSEEYKKLNEKCDKIIKKIKIRKAKKNKAE